MVLFSVWPLCARFCFLLLLLLLLDPLLYLVKRWKKFCKTYHLKDKEREREFVCELKFKYSEKAKNGTKTFLMFHLIYSMLREWFCNILWFSKLFVAFSENLNFKKLSLKVSSSYHLCVECFSQLVKNIRRKDDRITSL